ncbi:MAG: adenylate/guanylate cyclase domain-containing protein, partial [Proteobacteria bacterium]|nr:adenylate/guanylate cyclase domain-containing protein [Pseudomonadota bacterium]NDG25763.1 adenylate/guanylate cyclase domain-containing protein [Pseudomonadota bacterium]
EEALSLNKNDPRLKLIIARSQFASGNRKGAQKSFREYLHLSEQHSDRLYFIAYVTAMAYPIPVLIALLLFTWSFGFLLRDQFRTTLEKTQIVLNKVSKSLIILACGFLPGLLAYEFYSTGSVIPLGLLFVLATGSCFLWMAIPLWKRWLSHGVGQGFRILSSILSGVKFVRLIGSVSTGTKVLISLSTLFVLGTVVPLIPNADLRYAVSAISLFLFYGTVGSLIIVFIRSSKSLKNSMRWIGIAATLPFVFSYILSHWNDLGQPFMHTRLPSGHAVQALANYLIFWSFSVVLALHLSKILADAIVQPMNEILSKVQAIESGNFSVRTTPSSRDELGTLAIAVNHMAEGLQRREYIEKTFSRYIDSKVARRILSGNEDEVNIAGQRMTATVLFSDIRGFTTFSEQIPPEEVIKILNTYFSKMVAIVKNHGGVIDKFIGDAMLCVWGVPQSIPNGPELAVRCAWKMQQELHLLNQEFQQTGLAPLAMGVGINFGSVVAGSLGSNDRMEYTVIGDVVNTAQRVEGKASANTILITEETYELVKRLVKARSMGNFLLKGKSTPVPLWRVEDLPNISEQKAA